MEYGTVLALKALPQQCFRLGTRHETLWAQWLDRAFLNKGWFRHSKQFPDNPTNPTSPPPPSPHQAVPARALRTHAHAQRPIAGKRRKHLAQGRNSRGRHQQPCLPRHHLTLAMVSSKALPNQPNPHISPHRLLGAWRLAHFGGGTELRVSANAYSIILRRSCFLPMLAIPSPASRLARGGMRACSSQ